MKNVSDDEIEHIYLDNDEKFPPKNDSQSHNREAAVENSQEYKKLIYAIAGVTVVAMMLTIVRGISLGRFMADFMAVFFITFAAFKFVDIEGFADTFQNYDIVARLVRPWGYFLPFVEAFMGFWYLLSDGPVTLNILTMIVTGLSFIGIYRETYHRTHFQSAYLRTYLKVPFSKVRLIENVSMFALALGLLLLKA